MMLERNLSREREVKRIAFFGQLEKEHFDECVAEGLMTPEERHEELEKLKAICSASIEKVLSNKIPKCAP